MMYFRKLSLLRHSRAELIALALLVPLALILGLLLGRSPDRFLPASGTSTGSPSKDSVATPSFPSSTASPSAPAPAAVGTDVILEIKHGSEHRSYRLAVTGETTVADLLRRAEREQGLRLKTKDYGGSLGVFVEGIDGVENDPKAQMYWTLYVNGAFSQLGASSAKVRPGDTVTWAFEPMHAEN